jgi:hypothetical protein
MLVLVKDAFRFPIQQGLSVQEICNHGEDASLLNEALRHFQPRMQMLLASVLLCPSRLSFFSCSWSFCALMISIVFTLLHGTTLPSLLLPHSTP